MSEFSLPSIACSLDRATRTVELRDRIMLGLMLVAIVHTSEAVAGDHSPITNTPIAPQDMVGQSSLTAPSAAKPNLFAVPAVNTPDFSSTEFRPRKHTVFNSDPTINFSSDAPMLKNTTVWQRLAESKSHDSVQLLTLWESTGSAVSLQAGKRGNPSLQWTSRVMNRGGSTQGLLDHIFAASLAHASSRLSNNSRSVNEITIPRLTNVPVASGLK